MSPTRRHARLSGSRAAGRTAAALAVLGLGLLQKPAFAEVRVRVEAEGACPSPADLEREVGAWAAPEPDPSAPRWRLRAHSTPGGARLELVNPAGRTVLTRAVASNDCQALARAFALIAHAHFLELGLVRSLPPAPPSPSDDRRPPSPAGPLPSPAGPTPLASAPAPSALAPPAQPSPPAATSAPPASSALPASPPPEQARKALSPAPKPTAPGSLALSLGPGLALPLPASAPPPLGFIDMTVRPPSWGVDARLGAWLSAFASAGEGASVRRRFGLVSLTGGYTFGGLWAFRPEAGLGLLVSSVDAKKTDAPTRSVARATVKTGVSINYALAKAISVKGDFALHVLPWTDSYLVNRQTVGEGPRALLVFGVGLEGKTDF